MKTIILWTLKKLMTKMLYKQIALLVIDEGLGAVVKMTDNTFDDKAHKIVVEALKK
jgi:hypothetical protein